MCWTDASAHVWRPRAIAWAMAQANELFELEMTAERCAEILLERYIKWCDLMAEEPAKIAQAQAAAAQAQAAAAKKSAIENEVNLKRKNDLFLFQALFYIAITAFLSVGYFCVSRG